MQLAEHKKQSWYNQLCFAVSMKAGLFFCKTQRMRRAGRDTSRKQAGIDPVHTEITLEDSAGIRIECGNMPRAGIHTGFTADTCLLIDVHDAVRLPADHGFCRAYINAFRIFAMVAALIAGFHAGDSVHHFRQ